MRWEIGCVGGDKWFVKQGSSLRGVTWWWGEFSFNSPHLDKTQTKNKQADHCAVVAIWKYVKESGSKVIVCHPLLVRPTPYFSLLHYVHHLIALTPPTHQLLFTKGGNNTDGLSHPPPPHHHHH